MGIKKHNYFRNNVISEIIRTIKENKGINYDKLVNKLGVNEPFIREETAKRLIRALLLDEQITINDKGEVNLC